MKFFELSVGDKFVFNNVEHVKVQEERISCCKVGCNAKLANDVNSKVVLKPLDDVVKLEPAPEPAPAPAPEPTPEPIPES